MPLSIPRRQKYGARRTTVDGITFDSAAEARRYGELKLLERAGEISGLELQPEFPFLVKGKVIFKYVADFSYWDGRSRVTEDVKGFRTKEYILKRKLIEA